jgi:hypothetical protein
MQAVSPSSPPSTSDDLLWQLKPTAVDIILAIISLLSDLVSLVLFFRQWFWVFKVAGEKPTSKQKCAVVAIVIFQCFSWGATIWKLVPPEPDYWNTAERFDCLGSTRMICRKTMHITQVSVIQFLPDFVAVACYLITSCTSVFALRTSGLVDNQSSCQRYTGFLWKLGQIVVSLAWVVNQFYNLGDAGTTAQFFVLLYVGLQSLLLFIETVYVTCTIRIYFGCFKLPQNANAGAVSGIA